MIINKNFTLLVAGLLLSTLGFQIQAVTIGWYLYEKTGSAKVLGLVGLIQFLPILFFAIPAGYFVDVLNRKYILITAVGIFGLSSFLLALSSYKDFSLHSIFLIIFLSSFPRSFSPAARTALISDLVPAKDIKNAFTIWSGIINWSGLAGPAVGGFLISFSGGATFPFAVSGAMFLAFCLISLFIKYTRHNKAEISIVKLEKRSIHDFTEGIKFVYTNKTLLSTMTLDLFAVLFGGAVALLPVYAKDILKVDSFGLGILHAAPALGAFLTSIITVKFKPYSHTGKVLFLSVIGFGISTIIFGLSTNFILSLIALFFSGVFDNVSTVIRLVLTQTLTPNNKRGRVGSVSSIFVNASNELGKFESGTVASLTNPVFSVVSGGVGTLIVVAVMAFFSVSLRNYGEIPKKSQR